MVEDSVTDGSERAKNSTDTPPKNDVAELLRVLEKNCKAFVRTVAVLTSFGERLDAIERRLTMLEGEGVTNEMGEPAPTSSKRVVRREGST